MIRLLKWLIWGDAHLHKWEVYRTITWQWDKSPGTNEYEYVMRCKHCGNMKSFKT